MRSIALIVSYALHPLWMPLIVLGLLWSVDPWLWMQPAVMVYLASVLLINALAPAVSIYVLHKRGVLGDMEVSNRTERTLPFLIVLFYQGLGYFALTRPGVYLPPEILGMVVAMMAVLVLAVVVNRYIKMSMHMLAIGGGIGALWAFNQLHGLGLDGWLPAGFAVAGVVGWSRMAIGVHNLKELGLGFFVGFAVMRAVIESGWFP